MRTVPERRTTVRITGPDGVTWQGDGEGFAAALRDLARRHRRGEPPAAGEARWTLTAKGRRAVAALRRAAQERPPRPTREDR
jgi:hypothetical protein